MLPLRQRRQFGDFLHPLQLGRDGVIDFDDHRQILLPHVACGGGKCSFHRVGSHLESDLKCLLPEGAEEVADLAFAAGDDLAVFGVVDGVSDLPEHRFQLLTHLVNGGLGVERGHRFHGGPRKGVATDDPPNLTAFSP